MSRLEIKLDERTGGALLSTPDARYTLTWDDQRKALVIYLTKPKDHTTHDGSMVVLPRSGNAIAIRPQKRT